MTVAGTIFNSESVNPIQQNIEVEKATHAAREMCRAVKNMDGEHQRIAFYACLAALEEEFGGQNKQTGILRTTESRSPARL